MLCVWEQNFSYWYFVDKTGQRVVTDMNIYHMPVSVLGTLQSNLFRTSQNISIRKLLPHVTENRTGAQSGLLACWCQTLMGSLPGSARQPLTPVKRGRKNSEASHEVTAQAYDTDLPERLWEDRKWILWQASHCQNATLLPKPGLPKSRSGRGEGRRTPGWHWTYSWSLMSSEVLGNLPPTGTVR